MLKLQKVALSALEQANYNPKNRIKQRYLTRLIRSIENVGLVYPILIDEKSNVIIDGHRRYAACKKLGWDEIPCLISSGEEADTMYAEVNATQRGLSGNDLIQVYLKNPKAVTDVTRAKMLKAENTLGRKTLVEIAKRGLSYATFSEAERVARLIGVDSPEYVANITRWFMAFGKQREIRYAIQEGLLRADKFAACVKNMKPIRISYQAAK